VFSILGYKCSLHFLFGKNFERATRIVDQRGVKRISGEPSGRFIFQVKIISLLAYAFRYLMDRHANEIDN